MPIGPCHVFTAAPHPDRQLRALPSRGAYQKQCSSGESVQSEPPQRRRQSIEGGAMKYDVVIIGGGAAGAVVASRLAADAQTAVLLLGASAAAPPHIWKEQGQPVCCVLSSWAARGSS